MRAAFPLPRDTNAALAATHERVGAGRNSHGPARSSLEGVLDLRQWKGSNREASSWGRAERGRGCDARDGAPRRRDAALAGRVR